MDAVISYVDSPSTDNSRHIPSIVNSSVLPELNGEDVINLVKKHARELWEGDLSALDNDHSKADYALICTIYHYTQNSDEVDAIFRRSALMRDKWDTVHSSKGLTYGQMTINAATSNYTGDFYQPEEQAQKIADKILTEAENPAGEFDLHKMPTIIREFIQATSQITDAAPVMILMSILVSASAVLKTKVSFNHYFDKLFPNLWMLAIALSGAFKTTALNLGKRTVEDFDKEFWQDIHDLELKKPADEEEKDDIAEKIALLQKKLSILPDKITLEALIAHLVDHAGAIYCSEFGAWLKSLSAGTNIHGLKELLTALYDVPAFYRYLKQKDRVIIP